jgi:hypothetical protein
VLQLHLCACNYIKTIAQNTCVLFLLPDETLEQKGKRGGALKSIYLD